MPLNFQAMRFWRASDVKSFLESGGTSLPGRGMRVDPQPSEPLVTLDRYRAWGEHGATVYAACSEQADVVAKLKRGSALLAIGQLTIGAKRWLRIVDPYDGYVEATGLKPAFDEPSRSFDLIQTPAAKWREPRRAEGADITFTITFNGRLRAFHEALSSVLTQISPDDLAQVDAWVIICDKGATSEQRIEVQRCYPWATLIGKGASLHCHPISMNLLAPFIRTRWWLQWEDDWSLPPDKTSWRLLSKARDVANVGFEQVALNGAWLDSDSAWGFVGPPFGRPLRRTPSGTEYLEVPYPANDAARVSCATGPRVFSLIDGWAAQSDESVRNRGVKPLQWPLWRCAAPAPDALGVDRYVATLRLLASPSIAFARALRLLPPLSVGPTISRHHASQQPTELQRRALPAAETLPL